MNASTSLLSATNGTLLAPSDQVTGLQRRLGAEWLRSTDETDLDPETVLALAGMINVLADRFDVDCVAFMPQNEEI
ncbi:DUF6213 family protein [Streptomyces sp. NPDC059989]|uniref:DUF6213 family protein n=1 Tax=Streptomyces sp. NPDC059989 TaxID=3347026 RepID=UPI0036BA958B